MTVRIETLYKSVVPRYPELRHQVAVVTGAAQGIGLGITVRLACEGMRVMLADINAEKLKAARNTLSKLGASVWEYVGDLSQPEIIHRLFAAVKSELGSLQLLVNNAASLERGRLLEDHGTLLEQQLALNIQSPYVCSQQAATLMRETGGGCIIHISSVGALRAHNRGLPYDVTKGAINSMTQAMAVDLAEYNIRVNAIGPGAIFTERSPASESALYREVEKRIPLARFGTVSDIAAMVAFLASPEASYITGQVVYVDGGITTQLSPPGQPL